MTIVLHLSTGQEIRLAPGNLLYAGGRTKRADAIAPGDTLLVVDPTGVGDFAGDVAYRSVTVLVARVERDGELSPVRT